MSRWRMRRAGEVTGLPRGDELLGPRAARDERENPLRVDGVRASRETMQHEEKRRVLGGGRVEMVHEKRVAVRSGQRLAAHRHLPSRAPEASPLCLRMAAA